MTRARRIGLALLTGAEVYERNGEYRSRAVLCSQCLTRETFDLDAVCQTCRDGNEVLALEDAWHSARDAQMAEPRWRDA